MRRHFLFLQGPHGPFFANLAHSLQGAGASVERVLLNRGDALFWPQRLPRQTYTGSLDRFGEWIENRLVDTHVTDVVLYGDSRPVHKSAIAAANRQKVTIHVFEEGYLRPWWVTYERGGSNGRSPLHTLSLEQMFASLKEPYRGVQAPEGWGALYRHMVYGALYHAAVLAGGERVPSHREVPVSKEALLHVIRLFAAPRHALERRLETWWIRKRGNPFHLVLLQLDHDANFRDYGPFPDTETFVEAVIREFAAGAREHHRLVFKAHPLEDGRVPLRRLIARLTRDYGLKDRVSYVPGGRLGDLLDACQTALTVNSTAAQQALLRGRPVKALGSSVYSRPEFVSDQSLADFFASPRPPDRHAYSMFRQFLLETSQIPGSFYAKPGRRQILRQAIDMMLAEDDPYTLRLCGHKPLSDAAERQHLFPVVLQR